MIVRKGITSFYWRTPLPEFSFREFKQIAFACATQCGYSVVDIVERGVTPNFHSAKLRMLDESLLMLAHSNFSIIAFAEPREDYSCELTFRDVEILAECIAEMYPEIVIATTRELEREIQASDLQLLDRAEIEQVKYWKPKTIGELAFNWWD